MGPVTVEYLGPQVAAYSLCKSSFRKDQLKTLMKAHQLEREKEAPSKIDSPLAQYNKQGLPVCILCKVLVKDNSLWDAHCQLKSHKQNLIALKEAKAKRESQAKLTQPASSTPPAPPRMHEEPSEPDEPLVGGLVGNYDDEDQGPGQAAEVPSPKKRKAVENNDIDIAHEFEEDNIPPQLANVYNEEEMQSELVGAPRIQIASMRFNPLEIEQELEREYAEVEAYDDTQSLPSGFFDSQARTSKQLHPSKPVQASSHQTKPTTSTHISRVPAPPKDSDAELRALMDAIKASDIDFEAIDVDAIVVEDNEVDEQVNDELAGVSEREKLAGLKKMKQMLDELPVLRTEGSEANDREESSSEADSADLEDLLDWRAR